MIPCHCCGGRYAPIHKWGPRVFSCTRCGHNYRALKKINLAEYYNNEYREVHGNYAPGVREQYSQALINIIEPFLKDCDSVLEVGVGDGSFSKLLLKCTKNVSVCELDRGFEKDLSRLPFKDVFYKDFLRIPDEAKNEAVVGIDVLEHFYTPKDFKRKALKLAEKKVILQVPINRKLKVMKAGVILPFDGHYHYFTQESIARLFEPEFEMEFCLETERGRTANKQEMIVVLKRI